MQIRYPSFRTRVKICGITQPEDALFAVACGADAIGLVFYERSPRNVSICQARAIASVVPAFVSLVGLFVDAPTRVVRDTLSQLPLSVLQFHGNEAADYCADFCMPYIKAVRMAPDTDPMDIAARHPHAAGLLLDAFDPGAHGGTGATFDWQRISDDIPLPLILAGGLNTDNVALAVSCVHPYALDVSSGVERDKGIKDHEKVASFLREVYRVDNR